MLFCNVGEAYDNNLDKFEYVKEQEFRIHKNDDQEFHIPKNEDQESKTENFNGTSVKELKKIQKDNIENFSLSDFDIKSEKSKEKKSHNFYIQKFFTCIVDNNNSQSSILSSDDTEIFDHVKKCKYCKTKINQKIKTHFNKECDKKINEEHFKPILDTQSYNIREILVLVLIGIFIIFVLDFIIKIVKNKKI